MNLVPGSYISGLHPISGSKSIIGGFFRIYKNFSCTIQYNGDSFDQPYLQARYKFYELPDPFEGISLLTCIKCFAL